MSWFRNEIRRAVLTFPVVTSAMLIENGSPRDKDFQEFSYFEATIEGLSEIDAQKLLETFEKRIESCFNKREWWPSQKNTKQREWFSRQALTLLHPYRDIRMLQLFWHLKKPFTWG